MKHNFFTLKFMSFNSLAFLVACSSTVSAQGVQEPTSRDMFPNTPNMDITLSGKVEAVYGSTNQKFKYKEGKALKRHGLVNSSDVNIGINAKADNGLKYGGAIKTGPSTDSAKPAASQVYIYLQNDEQGKLQLGTFKGISDRFNFGAGSIAAATGGVDGDYGDWVAAEMKVGQKAIGHNFVTSPSLAVDHDTTSKANKVAYFSPSLAGMVLGIDFIPDTELKGTIAKLQTITPYSNVHYKNIITMGVKYETHIDRVKLNTGFIGQFGKAKKADADTKRKDLNAWQLGMTAAYEDISLAASYGDWGRSGTPAVKRDGAKYRAYFYTLGGALKYNDANFSLTYFEGKRGGSTHTGISSVDIDRLKHPAQYNKFSSISLGADYKLAQGALTYLEWTNFKYKSAPPCIAKDNKGGIVLGGLKVFF